MARRGSGEGTVFKQKLIDKDGKVYYKWQARINIGKKENGKPLVKSFSSLKSRQDAIDKLNQFKKENIGFIFTTKKILFSEYITTWAEDIKKPQLKITSRDRLDYFIKMINERIGQYNLNEIDSNILQQYITKVKADGYSRETIKKSLSIIKTSLDYAIKKKYINYNHANDVMLPSVYAFEGSNRKIEIFTEDELERFKATCMETKADGTPKILAGYAFIIMLNTGIRVGELIALNWKNININRRSVLICQNAVRVKNTDKKIKTKWVLKIQDSTKTKSSYRKLTLNNTARDALLTIKKYRYFGDGTLVFPTENNTINSKENIQRSLDYILKKANIEHKSTHVLRHTYASYLLKNKIDIKTISDILGHSNIKTTMQTYLHTIEQYKDAVMINIKI